MHVSGQMKVLFGKGQNVITRLGRYIFSRKEHSRQLLKCNLIIEPLHKRQNKTATARCPTICKFMQIVYKLLDTLCRLGLLPTVLYYFIA